MDKQFFMGTNTGDGFYSLFNALTSYNGDWRTYVLKGGPGTGKSGLMKKIADKAEQSGLYCERILCSSDPQSLDAVYIPEKKTSVCDGTAPHIVEPKFAGVVEQIVNIGAFWNGGALKNESSSIMQVMHANQFCHQRTARLLGAAKQLKTDAYLLAEKSVNTEKLQAFADKISEKIPQQAAVKTGSVAPRFLNGVTPDGVISFFDTAKALADDITVIRDDSGYASAAVIDKVAEHALRNGYDIILCKDFLLTEKNAHIIIPALSIAVLTANADCVYTGKATQKCSAVRFANRKLWNAHRENADADRDRITALLADCTKTLREAKDIHDVLESFYIKNMDFAALDACTKSLMREIFS